MDTAVYMKKDIVPFLEPREKSRTENKHKVNRATITIEMGNGCFDRCTGRCKGNCVTACTWGCGRQAFQ